MGLFSLGVERERSASRRGQPWYLRIGLLLVGSGLLWAALALIDPERRPAGTVLGPALALAGLITELACRRPWKVLVVPCVLAATFSVSTQFRREFRADSIGYYSYLRSLVIDGDLDFTNEWAFWGYPESPITKTGLRANAQSVGPAILWSPFFLAAHIYVLVDRAVGAGRYPADGYSAPYLGSAALGTLTVVVVGAALLVQMMARTWGKSTALVAVAGGILTSPVLYYAFVVPTMSHGVTFGAAAGFLWVWDRTRRDPSLATWTALGAGLGLLTLCRWQAAVYSILVLALAAQGLLTRTVRTGWLLAAASTMVAVCSPQILAWRILYGHFLTLPQGRGYLHWSSPHLLDTLISANHGFFAWTPAMMLGLAGLFVGFRRWPLLHLGSLLVFAATAWVNGSVLEWDWDGGDAFGARRYDLVVPLMALGLGSFLNFSTQVLARAPLLAPAMLVLLMSLWNVGFIALFRDRKYPEMAPLDRLARDQAQRLRILSQELMGRLGGIRGRALVYKYLSGEYFYTKFNRSGTINLWSADERYLLKGWGSRSRRIAKPTFRRALYPEACVRIPLDQPFDLRVEITARAPRDMEGQAISIVVNDELLLSRPLLSDWSDVSLKVPHQNLVPGENALCLRFSRPPPVEWEEKVAAEVSRIQLP